MSFLASSRVASKTIGLPPELLAACLHTSTPCSFERRRKPNHSNTAQRTSPSLTRLAKNITSSGKPKAAPVFERDSAPHIGRQDQNAPTRLKRLTTREEDLRRHKKKTQPASPKPSPAVSRDIAHPHPSASKPKPKVVTSLIDEFDLSTKEVSTKEASKQFTSPPLMEGLLTSIHDVLGADARPTPIQVLSLSHLVGTGLGEYNQYLLASETGSGKSLAYLLPMLQSLKESELNAIQRSNTDPSARRRALNPRALVLAPTHELSRQLSGFAKELLHKVKLRVLCASRANVPSRRQATTAEFGNALVESADGGLELPVDSPARHDGPAHPVDVVVGTPSKVLELMRGRKWDAGPEEFEFPGTPRRRRTVGEPTMGLANVEWVVVDEADVLFDPDFQEATRMILADISAARGHSVPFDPVLDLSDKAESTPLTYPFNLILTSATIPSSLAAYLDKFHPSLTRLASPHLHRLPPTLKTEHVGWTGGNRDADIEHRLRHVWYEDLQKGTPKSKVLVFCNKSTRVEALGATLREKGIANVALTSMGETRKRGSNHHLDGFLRVRDRESTGSPPPVPAPSGDAAMDDLKEVPHVMITTSLLSRGLDFAPDVKHVFIVDEPRNMVDFLHRAGRSGRAGEAGKVVVFGKSKGRGSEKARVVRKKVGALAG